MIFAYLIAAHQGGDQLMRLIDRLLPPGTEDYAVLHLDAKSDLWREERTRLERHASGRVIVVERPVSVFWGHSSQLEATRLMLDIACKHGFTLAHHISGVDWPIATRAEIIAALPPHGPLPAYATVIGPEQPERMDQFWFTDRLSRHVSHPRLKANIARAHERLSMIANRWQAQYGWDRSHPLGIPWQKGWSWWSLPYDVADDVRRELSALFRSGRLRLTACSDEHVVPTILTARHASRIADYRRFITWPTQSYHPHILTRDDLPAIRSSQCWFARKVDPATDDFYLDSFPPFA